MAQILKGKPVADRLTAAISQKTKDLKSCGIVPTLAILRVGENPGDIVYEKGALKRAEEIGISVRRYVLDADASQDDITGVINEINEDKTIHGALIFRPLPAGIDDEIVCESLTPDKDMDGITSGSMAGVFMDRDEGYPPCTAQACMEILDYYGVDPEGKRVTIFGRSLVIGRPVAMMAMKRNATVTICHSKTQKKYFAEAGKNADIIIVALGRAKIIDESKIGKNQIVIDVGINVDENGKVCGDVDFEHADREAAMVTPVPGGVGSVTTAVLMQHVAEAAEKAAKGRNGEKE